jgi:DNA-binding transcriptional LysR family regulator
MPLAVARFRRRHPEVSLTLAEGEPEEITPRLRSAELDLALLFAFDDPQSRRPSRRLPERAARSAAGLRSVTLLDDPMQLILPAAHPLVARPSLGLADLRREPWVQTSATSPCARHVVRCCVDAGFEPDVSFESDDYDTVQGLVAAGVGVALVPRLALAAAHPGIVTRTLHPSPVRRVTVATPAGVALAPAARSMIEELTEVARRHDRPSRAA